MSTAFLWLWISVVTVLCIGLIRSDLHSRTLPNSLVLAITVVSGIPFFPPINAIAAPFTTPGRSLVFGLSLSILAFFGHHRGLIGGGDAKVSFAVGLLVSYFGQYGWLTYLAMMIITGTAVLIDTTRTLPENKDRGLPLGPVFLTGIAPALVVSLGFGFQ